MRVPRSISRRNGFTLAEVLVTLAIIAVMAAVLLPSLTAQLSKGDTGRLGSDLTGIQSAAQAFVADVRRYPSALGDLTTAITASSTDLDGLPIPSTLLSKWKGPYLNRDVGNTAGGVIGTTFSKTAGGNGANYLGITVTSVPASVFAGIEALLDDGVAGVSSTNGVVHYNAGSSTLTFLALTIQ